MVSLIKKVSPYRTAYCDPNGVLIIEDIAYMYVCTYNTHTYTHTHTHTHTQYNVRTSKSTLDKHTYLRTYICGIFAYLW